MSEVMDELKKQIRKCPQEIRIFISELKKLNLESQRREMLLVKLLNKHKQLGSKWTVKLTKRERLILEKCIPRVEL